jgi:CheY-like chemotaxis protein
LIDLEAALVEAGAEIAGLSRSAEGALPLAADDQLSAAVLDIRLGSNSVLPGRTGTRQARCYFSIKVENDKWGERSFALRARGLTKTLRGKTILVIEDNWFIAEDIASLLRDAGAEVITAYGLQEAIAAAKKDIDAATVDIMLGKDFVWPAAEILRERQIPFVIVSGSMALDNLAVPEKLRRAPVVMKPFNRRTIVDALEIAQITWPPAGAYRSPPMPADHDPKT